MANKTRKAAHKGRRHTRRSSPQMTVEGLHASFEKLDTKARALVSQGATDSELSKGIHRAWAEQFHAELGSAAVRGLVAHYRAIFKGVNKTRKMRRGQKGGMAAVDWIMGPGTTAPVYGRFPVEMGSSPSALQSMDRFHESQVSRACDSTGGYPAPMQKGAGIMDSIFNGYAPASVPRNAIEMTTSAIQGRPIVNPPADPVVSRVPAAVFEPVPYNPQALTQISSLAPIYQPL
jgi:hypothetical protein